jgi:hypothetical protein
VVRSSGRSRPDIVSLSLRGVAWHCQRVPPSFVNLLRREERLSLEKWDQNNIDSSTSAPWIEHQPNGTHVDSTRWSALFFGLLIVWRSIVGDLYGPEARFVCADSRNKAKLRPTEQHVSLVLDGTQQIQEAF